MNRRALLRGVVATPLAVFGQQHTPGRIVINAFTYGDDGYIEFRIGGFITARSAEVYRRDWIRDPWGGGLGEWYVTDRKPIPLPPRLSRLPGQLTQFDILFGEAAERGIRMTAAFRREHVVCIMRTFSPGSDLAIATGTHFADAPLPALPEIAWSSLPLEGLIPSSDVLGVTLAATEPRWP